MPYFCARKPPLNIDDDGGGSGSILTGCVHEQEYDEEKIGWQTQHRWK